jgi:hypothetical protein
VADQRHPQLLDEPLGLGQRALDLSPRRDLVVDPALGLLLPLTRVLDEPA